MQVLFRSALLAACELQFSVPFQSLHSWIFNYDSLFSLWLVDKLRETVPSPSRSTGPVWITPTWRSCAAAASSSRPLTAVSWISWAGRDRRWETCPRWDTRFQCCLSHLQETIRRQDLKTGETCRTFHFFSQKMQIRDSEWLQSGFRLFSFAFRKLFCRKERARI